MPPAKSHRVLLSAIACCTISTAHLRVLPSAAECQPTDMGTTECHDAYEALLRATTELHITECHCAAPHCACNRMLQSTAARHGVPCRAQLSATDGNQVPPGHTLRATKCHRAVPLRAAACQHVPQRTAERHLEQHQVSTCASSGAQFSSTTEHHQAPLCAALRAMPTNADLTLICAGALQEPSQPILGCAETATPANAGRRAPPNDTECHKVHTSARHRAPPSGATRDAACHLPPRSTAFHRVPLSVMAHRRDRECIMITL